MLTHASSSSTSLLPAKYVEDPLEALVEKPKMRRGRARRRQHGATSPLSPPALDASTLALADSGIHTSAAISHSLHVRARHSPLRRLQSVTSGVDPQSPLHATQSRRRASRPEVRTMGLDPMAAAELEDDEDDDEELHRPHRDDEDAEVAAIVRPHTVAGTGRRRPQTSGSDRRSQSRTQSRTQVRAAPVTVAQAADRDLAALMAKWDRLTATTGSPQAHRKSPSPLSPSTPFTPATVAGGDGGDRRRKGLLRRGDSVTLTAREEKRLLTTTSTSRLLAYDRRRPQTSASGTGTSTGSLSRRRTAPLRPLRSDPWRPSSAAPPPLRNPSSMSTITPLDATPLPGAGGGAGGVEAGKRVPEYVVAYYGKLRGERARGCALSLPAIAAVFRGKCRDTPGAAGVGGGGTTTPTPTTPVSADDADLEGDARYMQFLEHCLVACSDRRLALADLGLGPEAMRALQREVWSTGRRAELATSPVVIDVSENPLGDEGASVLAECLRHPSSTVVAVRARSCGISGVGGQALFAALAEDNVTCAVVDLSGQFGVNRNLIGPSGATACAYCLRLSPTLSHLNLASNGLGPEGALILSEGLSYALGLEVLDLSSNSIGVDGAVALMHVVRRTRLRVLRIGGNAIGPEAAMLLAEVLTGKTTAAEVLKGRESHADARSPKSSDHGSGTTQKFLISHTPRSVNVWPETLRELDLSDNKIGAQGASQLIPVLLSPSSPLQRLRLCNCQIGNEGAMRLAQSLRENHPLAELYVAGNSIFQEGAEAIAEAVGVNANLVVLDLARNYLGDEGAIAFSRTLRTNHTLLHLHLSRNQIAEAGGIALARLVETLTYTTGGGGERERERERDGGRVRGIGRARSVNSVGGRMCSLVTLDLRTNGLQGQAGAAFAETLAGNYTLRHLQLEENSIPYTAAKEIAVYLERNMREYRSGLQGRLKEDIERLRSDEERLAYVRNSIAREKERCGELEVVHQETEVELEHEKTTTEERLRVGKEEVQQWRNKCQFARNGQRNREQAITDLRSESDARSRRLGARITGEKNNVFRLKKQLQRIDTELQVRERREEAQMAPVRAEVISAEAQLSAAEKEVKNLQEQFRVIAGDKADIDLGTEISSSSASLPSLPAAAPASTAARSLSKSREPSSSSTIHTATSTGPSRTSGPNHRSVSKDRAAPVVVDPAPGRAKAPQQAATKRRALTPSLVAPPTTKR